MEDLNQLVANLEIAKKALSDFDSGFKYKVISSAYGRTSTWVYKNWMSAYQDAASYNGDNGFADIETNDTSNLGDFPPLYAGDWIFVESL